MHKDSGTEAGAMRGGSPARGSGRPPKSSEGPLGGWETSVGERQTDMLFRERLSIEFI